MQGMREREKPNKITKILKTEKIEVTEEESGLEKYQDHSFGQGKLEMLFRHLSG